MKVKEVWKPYPKALDYKVSNLGRVKRLGKLLPQSEDSGGYWNVWLVEPGRKGRTFRVHRMVAQTFIPLPEGYKDDKGLEVNHKDGDKHHNLVSNLEWATHQENAQHAVRTGLTQYKGRKKRLNRFQVNDIRERLDRGEKPQDLADEFGFSVWRVLGIKRDSAFKSVWKT